MALNLFYITNRPEVAVIAQKAGVDRIWVDLEQYGKKERQKNMNSVQSKHQISDVATIKPLLTTSQLMVRVDPWEAGIKKQIDDVIAFGADIIMLPMWKTADEVRQFLEYVNGRTKTSLLLETKEAMACVDEVLKLDFDEIHIGLNDLHLSCGMTFMFELLVDGTVEKLCKKFREKGVPYGFGGIARIGYGDLPAEKVILEHYRLGSTRAILSRSFCNVEFCKNVSEVETIFIENMKKLRDYEKRCETISDSVFEQNRTEVEKLVAEIVKKRKEMA